jgi:hypothetical protein
MYNNKSIAACIAVLPNNLLVHITLAQAALVNESLSAVHTTHLFFFNKYKPNWLENKAEPHTHTYMYYNIHDAARGVYLYLFYKRDTHGAHMEHCIVLSWNA